MSVGISNVPNKAPAEVLKKAERLIRNGEKRVQKTHARVRWSLLLVRESVEKVGRKSEETE